MKLLTVEEINRGKFSDIEDSKILKYGKCFLLLSPYFYLLLALLFKWSVWQLIGVIIFTFIVSYYLLGYLVLCDCYIGESAWHE